jgi:hypothetical protein
MSSVLGKDVFDNTHDYSDLFGPGADLVSRHPDLPPILERGPL